MIESVSRILDGLATPIQKILLIILLVFSFYIHLHLGISVALLISIYVMSFNFRKLEYFRIEEKSSIFFLCEGIPFFYQSLSTIAYVLIRLYTVLSVIGIFYLSLYKYDFGWLWSIVSIPISFVVLYILGQLILRIILNIKKGEKIFLYLIDLDKKFKGIIFYEDY